MLLMNDTIGHLFNDRSCIKQYDGESSFINPMKFSIMVK